MLLRLVLISELLTITQFCRGANTVFLHNLHLMRVKINKGQSEEIYVMFLCSKHILEF